MNSFEKFAAICRSVVPEGITLLEHDGALPLSDGEHVALFGRGQFEYIKSGTGSGGRVNCPYVTNIGDELEKRVCLDTEIRQFFRDYIKENPFDPGDGWYAPPCQKQPMLDADLVKRAAERCDKAIFILTRTVGESFDCHAEAGSWFLSEAEEQSISALSANFKHLIVLVNSGNLIDMSWVKKYNVGTVLYVWQGGQEGGTGTVDALMGDVPPGGRLADTIADSIYAYPSTEGFADEVRSVHKEDIFVGYRYFETFAPERVLYPFGYGLGYTELEHTILKAKKNEDTLSLSISVKNTGAYKGRDVVQVYFSAPQGALGKPARQLIAFKKTKMLLPGEEQTIELSINVCDLASYDDSNCGKSGYSYAYVLEAGEYSIYEGKNVRDAVCALSFTVEQTRLVRQCVQALAPVESFDRMISENGSLTWEPVSTARYDTEERISQRLPAPLTVTGDRGIHLKDVKEGRSTLDEFIAQFTSEELMHIVCGEGMSSPKAAVPGTASCFCGVTRRWNAKGVPVVTTCDGPSGVRMESAAKATCIPVGTLIACSWLPETVDGLFDCFADEMLMYNVDVILAPGMNIHRNPLCGRNFEYFSEDPLLTGKCAAKIAERMTKKGVYCTLKHFAVNSQETKRNSVNEVLSERALREIYLKGFEIAVKSGYVRSIMTSYNLINGYSAGACYDLTTTILRDEWGYDSFVMTDWWPTLKSTHSNSFRNQNLSVMIKAQNDVFMCVPDAISYAHDMREAYEEGYLTLGELQRCAKNLVRFSMETLAFRADRKIDIDCLEECSELIFDHDLGTEPSKAYVLPENRYGDIPRKRIALKLDRPDFYCAELVYAIGGDALKQQNIVIYMDKNEPIRLTCSGTDGKVASRRFKMYLNEDTILYFEGDGLLGFKLYQI